MEADVRTTQLPIDYFFRSLARDQKERAIGIVLSGTGTDGSLGLKAIKGELGEIDDEGAETEEFQRKIAEAQMPEDVEKVALKQLNRLKQMQPSSAEYTVTRTYLEWLVELPWDISTEDKIQAK